MSESRNDVQLSEEDARYSALRGRIGAIELLLSMAFAVQHKDCTDPMQELSDTLGSLKAQYMKNTQSSQEAEPANAYLAELLKAGERAALESFDHIMDLSQGLLHSLQPPSAATTDTSETSPESTTDTLPDAPQAP